MDHDGAGPHRPPGGRSQRASDSGARAGLPAESGGGGRHHQLSGPAAQRGDRVLLQPADVLVRLRHTGLGERARIPCAVGRSAPRCPLQRDHGSARRARSPGGVARQMGLRAAWQRPLVRVVDVDALGDSHQHHVLGAGLHPGAATESCAGGLHQRGTGNGHRARRRGRAPGTLGASRSLAGPQPGSRLDLDCVAIAACRAGARDGPRRVGPARARAAPRIAGRRGEAGAMGRRGAGWIAGPDRRLLRAPRGRGARAHRAPRLDRQREMTEGRTVAWASEPPPTADLVIIGGGVAGAATAFVAHRAGLSPVVLEARPALGTASTSAATGAFRLQFDNPEELALVRDSVSFFHAFAEHTGLQDHDLGLHAQGYLWVATDDATARRQRDRVARQREWGLDDVEVLAAAELRRRFPYLAADVVQARHRPGDGWLDPRRLTLGLARASGATFVPRTMVTRLENRGGALRSVETDRGAIHAAAAVVAAGSFSARLAATIGLALPIQLVRRHRLVVMDAPGGPQDATMTMDEITGTHWRPAGTGAHVMRPDPDEPAGEALEDVPTRESFAFDVLDPASPLAAARLSPFWREVWSRGTSPWLLRAGQYDLTPDHRPLLGATEVPGLYLNCGHSGHGVMTSIGAARRVVDSILGRLAPSANPFRPDRPMAGRDRDVL